MVGIFGIEIEGPLNGHTGIDDRILDRYLQKQAHNSRTLDIYTSFCLGGKFLTWSRMLGFWGKGSGEIDRWILIWTFSEIAMMRKR